MDSFNKTNLKWILKIEKATLQTCPLTNISLLTAHKSNKATCIDYTYKFIFMFHNTQDTI